jgi:hypothetical protein
VVETSDPRAVGHRPAHDAPAPAPSGPDTRAPLPSFAPPSEGPPATAILRHEEAARARIFFLLALGLGLLLLLFSPFLGGAAGTRQMLVFTVAPVVLTTGWLSWRLRDEAAYSAAHIALGGAACLVGALGAIYHFGIFSLAVGVLPVGLFFFGTVGSEGMQLGAYAGTASGYFTLAALVMRGTLASQGLVGGGPLLPTQRLMLIVLIEAVLLVAFVNARTTRSATILAIARHERLARGLAQREALLKEARQDLARALDFAGLGRYSDTTIGSFHLGTVIGRGGMGEVYDATRVSTSELAAVKVLHVHTQRDPKILKRFLREAEIAASLDALHVVRVLEIGGFDGQLPYIAMERLVGEDLAERLRKTPSLRMEEVLRLIEHVGRGLEAARKAGIVHRDLKPRNLFSANQASPKQPVWKILDFGVSKLIDHDSSQETQDRIVGTPEYMAPEQAAGAELSHRTDLYSLAVITYRALTGGPAFSGDHIAEVLYQVAHTMPPRPSAIVDLPEEVDLVLAVAMAKAPSDRFDSAEELRVALEAASQGSVHPGIAARAQKLLEEKPWGHGRQA